MPIGARRPFTEIVEVSQTELVREASSNSEPKYKGCVNQVYMNDMPSELPERYLRKQGFVNLTAAYSAGTITVASGSTIILGASTSWTSANSDAYINAAGYNRLYRLTFTNSTVLTLKNSLTWIGASASGVSYTLIQDRYAAPSDFMYMCQDNPEDPNIVSYMVNGYQLYLTPWTNEQFDRNLVPTISFSFANYTVKFDAGNPYIHIWPFPLNSDILSFWYMPLVTAMVEYTTGTVTFTTGTAAVGSSTLWTSLNTANTYFIRNDADGVGSASVWVQIATVGGDSALSLSSGFTGTSGTGITYTISEISKWPARFDDYMLYKTCEIIDPDGVQTPKWQGLANQAIGLDKTVESKRKRDSKLKSFSGQR